VSRPDIRFIGDLETIVRARLDEKNEDSYTARLAAAGTRRIAQKVGEEGIELALAASSGTEQETIDEAADLIYHVIVLLSERGLSLEDVSRRLETRHGPD
jgi:phosphoribosyl-ATP pyrophosphohydrolase/phosphoribosyl-AMP cyclohydrolase